MSTHERVHCGDRRRADGTARDSHRGRDDMTYLLKTVLVAAGAALLALPAAAEYPERPVQLISPYPAGGAADVLARYLGKELEAQLGKPVIILNKPGAGTIIGAQAAATAPPDGYTLFLSSNSTFSANPGVYAKLP